MDSFLYSINATVPIFLVMIVGWVIKQLGVIDDHFANVANKYVFKVVQAGEKYFLIGVTSQQINLLKEIDADDLILLNPDQAGNAGKTPEFKELLTKLGKYTQRGGKKDV